MMREPSAVASANVAMPGLSNRKTPVALSRR